MNKADLQSKLDTLQTQSDDTLKQIDQHKQAVETLTEQALLIKGEYLGIKKLMDELPDTPPKPVKATVIKPKKRN